MRRLGLTGGIGSGKSTVAAMLRTLGAAIIDADANSRAVSAAGGDAIESIRKEFGSEFIDAEGALDRERMRRLAFSDPTARRRLEAIIHPRVAAIAARQLAAAEADGHDIVVLDIPLLVESGRWRQQLHQVLVVDCLPGTQVRRVMQRSGLAESAVLTIVAQQASRAARLAAADAVIYNEGLSMESLGECVAEVARRFGL